MRYGRRMICGALLGMLLTAAHVAAQAPTYLPQAEPATTIPSAPTYGGNGAPIGSAPIGSAPIGTPIAGYGNSYGGSPNGSPYASPYGSPYAAQNAAPNAGAPMPPATYNFQDFSRNHSTTTPPPQSKWMPTYSRPLLPGACGPAACGPQACGPTPCYPSCDPCATCGCWYENITAFSVMDAFKNGLDLDGLNANFGKRVGLNAAFPIFQPLGLGAQIGSSAGWYDWKGSQFTGDRERFQNFNTVGVFHRSACNGIGFGVVYDWLFDDYYRNFSFGQFRVAGSWQFNACNEIGVWAALPDRRDWAVVGAPPVNNAYTSVLQGNFYWRHVYNPGAWSTIYAGLAESPADIPVGVNAQVALNDFLALYGGYTYILPGSGGLQGHQEEIWNLTFGVVYYPGTARQVGTSQFRGILPMADNGNFAIQRR